MSYKYFNKDLFAGLLKKCIGDDSIQGFSERASIDRTYLSKYVNKRLDNPPKPEILKRIALACGGKVSYKELMEASGYMIDFNSNDSDISSEVYHPEEIFFPDDVRVMMRDCVDLTQEQKSIISNIIKEFKERNKK